MKYLVCITGASGAVYGLRTMRALLEGGHDVYAVVSQWGERVITEETGRSFAQWALDMGLLQANRYAPDNMAAPVASGSFKLDGTVIAPCSMNSANCRLHHKFHAV